MCTESINTGFAMFMMYQPLILQYGKSRIDLFCMLTGGGIWTTIRIAQLRLFADKPLLHTPALVWFVTASAADILITVSLVINLWQKKTGHATTDALIDRISALTIQTGLLTSLVALMDVVLFLVLPVTYYNARVSWNHRLEGPGRVYDDNQGSGEVTRSAHDRSLYDLEASKMRN
ncbi:hypothetical protein H0H92_008729 [Tricholoma furcatifolium]|nr:hypothetical protein H0H92_008729 [Tricholoma furcatifolium]